MLLRVEPLLCNDIEMGGYTRTVSGQRLGKHVPEATDTHITEESFIYMVRAEMLQARDIQFCTGVWEERS
jgi:hypothetical protein